MRKLITLASLAALIVAPTVNADADELLEPATTASVVVRAIEVTPESLAPFQGQLDCEESFLTKCDNASPANVAQAMGDERVEGDPAWWWRAEGLFNVAACVLNSISVSYRQSRSAWDPPVSNELASGVMWSGISVAANMLTDFIRRSGGKDTAAFAGRTGVLGVCGVSSIENFYQGWKRQ